MSVLTKVPRAGEGKKVRRLAELVPLVNALEPEMEARSDDELAALTGDYRQRLANGESLEDLLVESFALVREAAWRVLGQRHFDAQLMGGMALHFGWIAEMKTGEGKTLVSTLPVYLNALEGNGVHVVTVNDYLATRDSEWMGQLHRFLGLTVGRVGPDIEDPEAKRQAYGADLTYATNPEFGFDYLRDNMARSQDAMVQRGHHFAIVDEVDSILIDEARTPLIISGPAAESAQLYYQFAGIVRTLRAEDDYEVDEEKRIVVPTEAGIEKVEKQLGVGNLYDAVAVNYVHHLTQALYAKELYRRDKDYLVAQGEGKIVERHSAGQPVLVGTASVSKSEHLSRLLEKKGIPHEVLNAKQHFREAEIVAQAGRVGGVTVATNMAGRGVDIILGGNPEGLAAREAQARGIDPTSEEGQAALVELQSEFDETCRREGEDVRASGGLYVLGSERHESRRIDNQLRGRSGRQGDPGESRFFLSLEDDLMRLFATGAMNWVMGRALPDDVPIEAKMVTKAIERAQNTVEGRNAESRKDVLKYDDVMNEQRKVIYRRRNQIIDGEDLRDETVELLETTMTALVASSCPSDYPEEWDLPRLVTEITQYYPTKFVADDLAGATTVGQVTESILTEALDLYAERDETIPGGEEIARQLERDIMLQIIDQRWQDHLAEMDYLREGINLRAMGNQDPLVAYQREGFAMFGKLMDGIGDDYLRYVFHVQVITEPAPEPNLVRANYLAADDPVQGDGAITAAFAAAPPAELEEAAAAVGLPGGNGAQVGVTNRLSEDGESQVPIVKSEREKIGRNEPCWCGSAKKYKFCHG